MQRSESRAESSLSGYAERRMLSTKVKCKGVQSRKLAVRLLISGNDAKLQH